MFYRRKIILSLIQLSDGQIDKISLQKLLFLFTRSQEKAEYDFIPYQYGCFSFSANADLTTMVNKGILTETSSHFILCDKTDFFASLKEKDKEILRQTKRKYGTMSTNVIMKHTYINYPYWAINSIKAKEILTQDQYNNVLQCKPKNNQSILYTIGYEGISLEEYLNRLLKNNIKALVDVRNNPLSMKYGFSKNQLERFCEKVNIKYYHFPEVGIQSDQRQELNNQSDYDQLFSAYRKNNLSKTGDTQIKIIELLKEFNRIALTCFEANICQCHRLHLANAIHKLTDFEYEIKHI